MSLLATSAVAGVMLHCVGVEKWGSLWEEKPTSFELSLDGNDIHGIGGPFERTLSPELHRKADNEVVILAELDWAPAAQLQFTLRDKRRAEWMIVEIRGRNGEASLEGQGNAICEISPQVKADLK